MAHGVKKQKNRLLLTAYRAKRPELVEGLTNKKLQSPPNEEMEFSQRTGRLSIVCLMGRGTPLAIILVI